MCRNHDVVARLINEPIFELLTVLYNLIQATKSEDMCITKKMLLSTTVSSLVTSDEMEILKTLALNSMEKASEEVKQELIEKSRLTLNTIEGKLESA